MKKMTYHTLDEVKETFIDINIDRLLDMYNSIKDEYEDIGFLNKTHSSDLIHLIVDSLIFNDIYNDHSSEDES